MGEMLLCTKTERLRIDTWLGFFWFKNLFDDDNNRNVDNNNPCSVFIVLSIMV